MGKHAATQTAPTDPNRPTNRRQDGEATERPESEQDAKDDADRVLSHYSFLSVIIMSENKTLPLGQGERSQSSLSINQPPRGGCQEKDHRDTEGVGGELFYFKFLSVIIPPAKNLALG